MRPSTADLAALKEDLTAHAADLIRPGFVADTGAAQLRHLPRYLQGMLVRLEKAPLEPWRDAQRLEVVRTVEAERRKVEEHGK